MIHVPYFTDNPPDFAHGISKRDAEDMEIDLEYLNSEPLALPVDAKPQNILVPFLQEPLVR